MQAIKQVVKAPANRELRIILPNDIAINTDIEVILVYSNVSSTFDEKLNTMASVVNDPLFHDDLNEVVADFDAVDKSMSFPLHHASMDVA